MADEIISMLDASTRIDVLNLLGELKARGLGILFITHDLSLGNYISERTVILRRGLIVEMGATQKVFGNPLHPYTRTLVASVPNCIGSGVTLSVISDSSRISPATASITPSIPIPAGRRTWSGP